MRLKKPVEVDPKDLPNITGWSLLIQPVEVEEKTRSGLYLPDSEVNDLAMLASIGKVVKLAPLAYKEARLGNEPWCKAGDYVVFGKHDGERFTYKGVNFVLLNDDRVTIVFTEDQINDLTGVGEDQEDYSHKNTEAKQKARELGLDVDTKIKV